MRHVGAERLGILMSQHLQSIKAPLTWDRIRQETPSVFATQPWGGVSSKYKFIPTSTVLEKLAEQDIYPFSVQQSKARTPGKETYTKHIVRLRPLSFAGRVQPGVHQFIQDGGIFPEVVLTNSHDTGSAYVVEIGFFRLICLNGAIASVGQVGRFSVPHIGSQAENVIDATYRVLDGIPQLVDTVQRLQSKELTREQQIEFANRAIGLRWKPEDAPFPGVRLLQTRRAGDTGYDAFTIFNRVQENLLRGGLEYRTEVKGRESWRSTREIKGVDSNLEINRGLWALAHELVGA
jgi:hypothetical protein